MVEARALVMFAASASLVDCGCWSDCCLIWLLVLPLAMTSSRIEGSASTGGRSTAGEEGVVEALLAEEVDDDGDSCSEATSERGFRWASVSERRGVEVGE